MSLLAPAGGYTAQWWAEASAEWAAHQAEDSYGWGYGSPLFTATDGLYARTIGHHLGYPTLALTTSIPAAARLVTSASPEYGSFLFAEYLEEQFGTEVIRQTWNALDAPAWSPVRAIDAIETVLDELHDAQLSDVITNYHAANYTITNPKEYDLGYTGDADRDLWTSRLTQAGLKGRPAAWTVVPRWSGQAVTGWTTVGPGGAFYVDLLGDVDGSDAQAVNVSVHVSDPDSTVVQLRHIASYDTATLVAQECRGWAWAEPYAPDANGDVSIDLTLFEACPNLAVIVSSTDPNPAQAPTVVSYTVTARALSTSTVVEDLGGHGIHYRVENSDFLDQNLEDDSQLELWVNLGQDWEAAEGYTPEFCVYSSDYIPHATLDAFEVDGQQVIIGFGGQSTSGAGRNPASSGPARQCHLVPRTCYTTATTGSQST